MSTKIVVIDDDLLILKGFRIYLEDLGYQVFTADNCFEGLELIDEVDPDLIITDLIIPKYSGIDLLHDLKKRGNSAPIVVISGTSNISHVVEAHRIGAWDYITKPIEDFEIIGIRIETVLNRKRLQHENRIYQDNLKRLVDKRTEKIKNQNSELKKLLSTLEKSEARNRIFLDNSFEGLIFVKDGKIVEANRKFFEIFGVDENNYIKNISEYFMDESLSGLIDPISETDEPVFEVDGVNHSGVFFPVEVQRREVVLDGDRLLSIAIRDISSKREIEHKSITYTNYFENILNVLPSLVLGCDRYGDIVFVNRNVELLIEKEFSIISESKIDYILSFIPEVRESLFEVFDSGKSVDIPRVNVDYKGLKLIKLLIIPIDTPHGVQAIFIITDLTEQENREAEYRQAQKMESIGNLAGGLAHDFNNVLVGISGSASLIKHKYKPTGDFKEYLDIIESSVSRAADMVRQIMTLSRKQKLSYVPTDLNLSLKHVIKICKNSFDKSISIDFNGYCKPAVVSADPTQIEQIFLNICINASHAMTIMRDNEEDSGGVLTLSVEGVEADSVLQNRSTTFKEGAKLWMVKISDTGVGIAQDIVDKIYEPFFTTKDKESGSGLGLSMVYNLVNLHHGAMEIETELGKGTTFKLYFPQQFNRESSVAKQISIISHMRCDGSILLIDDEEVIRRVGKDMLEQFGYDVVTASDGLEAIQLFQHSNEGFTAVILDINMPKQSGEKTFKQLRLLDSDVPIFIASGYKRNSLINSLMSDGAAGFIQKPYTLGNLSDILDSSI